MKKIDLESLKDAANRLLFDMSDNEYKTLLDEFEVIKEEMKIISEDKAVDNISPMVFPFDVTTNVLREDVPSIPNSRDEILKNAKNKVAGQIKLPKVVS